MRLRPLALAGAAILGVAPAQALAAWGAPVRVSAADAAGYRAADVALAPGGDAVAVWVRTPAGASSGGGRVQVSQRSGTVGTWSRPVTVLGRVAFAPRVALGARGDAVVVWSSGPALLAAVRRGESGPWVRETVAEVGVVQDAAVAIDGSGHPVVMWSERRGAGFLVRLAVRRGGARWSLRPARLSVPGPAEPALALSPGAGALVAWVDDDRLLASRTADGAFERPLELSDDPVRAATAALSPGGAGLAAWSARLPGGTPVMLGADRRRDADRWRQEDDLGIGLAPVASLDDRGDAVVAWGIGEAGQDQGVEGVTRRQGGAWRASTAVSRETCSCLVEAVRAAVDAGGGALVAWRRTAAGGIRTGGAAAVAAGGTLWRRAPRGPAGVGAAPAIAAAEAGRGLAVWVGRDGPGGVWASVLRP
jgi:hypothetical protein